MSIFLPSHFLGFDVLELEGHDVRPAEEAAPGVLRILLVNQMPWSTKQATDTQWARLLASTGKDVHLTLAMPDGVPGTDGQNNYPVWSALKERHFDALILTGANLEHKKPEEITTWPCLQEILEWSKRLRGSFFVCWAAQIALEHQYGIERRLGETKFFGRYSQVLVKPRTIRAWKNSDPGVSEYAVFRPRSAFVHDLYNILEASYNLGGPLLGGRRAEFGAPHPDFSVPVSRYCYVDRHEIDLKARDLEIILDSPSTHVGLACSPDGSRIYSFNHPEYDRRTLLEEYLRDRRASDYPDPPRNYDFLEMNTWDEPPWRTLGQIVIDHWINRLVKVAQLDYSI